MKRVNLFIRYIGFFILLLGTILNFKMYFFNEWPTYFFFIIILLGILLIGISYLKSKKNHLK
jgi:predicted membrane channel-forming protein YqfA (hemolysin III family)